jgi:hypothetical protein
MMRMKIVIVLLLGVLVCNLAVGQRINENAVNYKESCADYVRGTENVPKLYSEVISTGSYLYFSGRYIGASNSDTVVFLQSGNILSSREYSLYTNLKREFISGYRNQFSDSLIQILNIQLEKEKQFSDSLLKKLEGLKVANLFYVQSTEGDIREMEINNGNLKIIVKALADDVNDKDLIIKGFQADAAKDAAKAKKAIKKVKRRNRVIIGLSTAISAYIGYLVLSK